MSWDASIIAGTLNPNTPLGNLQDVVLTIEKAVPGLRLVAPPVPPKEVLDTMPTFIREQAMTPRLEGDFETGELSMRFSTINSPLIYWLNIEVRGEGNPFPILDSICRPMGWVVQDSCDKQIVDLTSTDDSAWNRYCQWRNEAIGGEA